MSAKARARTRTRRRSSRGGIEALQKRLEAAKESGGYRVKIGLPSGAAPYPDGTSVIKVGAIQEFGSDDGTIPERSWLRSAMRANSRQHRKLIRKLAMSVSSGDRGEEDALELLGTIAADNVRDRIVDIASPPNAPSTIAGKGSSNPLVDTGHLVQSVTHQVFKGKK